MEPDSDLTYQQALSSQQAPGSQQGMSPNIAGAENCEDLTVRAASVGEYGTLDREAVAVRTLAVSVPPGSPIEPPVTGTIGQIAAGRDSLVGFPYGHQDGPEGSGSMIGRQNALGS